MNRRGSTLLELLLAITLAGGLLAGLTPLLHSGSRAAVTMHRATARERDLLTTWGLLTASLTAAAPEDLVIGAAGEFSFDRPLAQVAPCGILGGDLLISRQEWGGARDPVGGRDDLLLLPRGDSTSWIRAPIGAIAPGQCPGGGAAWRITTPGVPSTGVGVLRAMEPVRWRLYRSRGAWWLGLEGRPVRGAIQPFAGPFAAAGVAPELAGGLLEVGLTWQGGAPVRRIMLGVVP